VTGLLDTNVALYLLGGRLAETLPPGDYGISVITEMELLAYPTLTVEEENHVRLASVSGLRCRAVQLK
jgi:predicted nucleic acid-binding protein